MLGEGRVSTSFGRHTAKSWMVGLPGCVKTRVARTRHSRPGSPSVESRLGLPNRGGGMILGTPAETGGFDGLAAGAGLRAGLAGSGIGRGGRAIRAVAARFGVSPSYVSKVHSRRRRPARPRRAQHNHVAPRLAPLYDALRARVAEQADATIAELRGWVKREHGIVVSHPVMWSALARLGLTLKKTVAGGRTGPRRCRRSTRRMGRADARTRHDQAGFYR